MTNYLKDLIEKFKVLKKVQCQLKIKDGGRRDLIGQSDYRYKFRII
jgi:hypothetical protein